MIVSYISYFCKILFVVFLLSSCSLQQFMKKAENQKILVSPKILERYGDSVRFELKAELPRQIITKDIRYEIIPEFHFDRKIQTFDKSIVFEGKNFPPSEIPKNSATFSMPYYEGMENGQLETYGVGYWKGRTKGRRSSSSVISQGMLNTPSLTQFGQSYQEKGIPELGLYVPTSGRETLGMYQSGWTEIRTVVMGYSLLSFSEKSQYMRVIEGKGDFTYKERMFQELPQYALFRRDVIPRLLRLEQGISIIKQTPMEISIMANHILKSNAVPQVLSEEDLAYAAMNEPRLKEKNELFAAMVKAYPSVFSWNNLGVTYLNLAQRSFDRISKMGLMVQAQEAFIQANEMFVNPFASYNLALLTIMNGDGLGAYQEFFISMSLSQHEPVRKMHQAKLGAASILNGDYRLAAIHLDQAERNEINLFNRGLAYFMARDFFNATISFEDSALLNFANGYPFYGLALVASRSGEEGKMVENIERAITRTEYLRNRVAYDLEFADYHQTESFLQVIRNQ
jgi:tetratricopeptide (TPR) repeat protein